MAKLSRTAKEFLIDGVASEEWGLEIIAAIEAGGGSIGIGSSVNPSNANQILYVNGSHALAQSGHLTFDGTHFDTDFNTVVGRNFGLGTSAAFFGFFPGASLFGSDATANLMAVDGIFDGTGFIGSPVANVRYNNNTQTNDSSFDILTAGSVQYSAQSNVFSGGLSVDTNNGTQLSGHPSDTYTFTLSAPHNATAGAIYKQGSSAFVVKNTIVGGATLIATNNNGSIPPAGSLTRFSGSGDTTIAYSSYVKTFNPAAIFFIKLNSDIGWHYSNLDFILPQTAGSVGQVMTITSTSGATVLGWGSGGGGSVSIGTFDGLAPDSNGLSVSGSVLYAQSASASVPGMVNTGAQIFGGKKTFQANATFQGSIDVSTTVGIRNGSRLFFFDGADSNFVSLAAPSLSGNFAYILPDAYPAANSGYFLSADTSGTMSWQAAGGSVSIGVFDGNGVSGNGLSYNAGAIFAQSADANNPGMINATSTISSLQTMRGDKLFISYPVNISATGLAGEVNTSFNSPGTGQVFTGVLGQVGQGDGQDHTSDTAYGFNSIVNWNNSGSIVAGFNNGVFPAGSGTLGQVFGISNIVNNQSTLNISNEYGVYTHMYEGTSGAVNILASAWSEIYIANTGSFSSVFGNYVAIQAIGSGVGGSITNAYGYFISSMPSNIASNAYGFFDASNSISQFGQVNLMDATVSNGGGLVFYTGANTGAGNNLRLQLPNSFASNAVYTLPNAYPISNGQVMASTTSGTMSWVTLPAAGHNSFGGAGTVQFAGAAGAFNGDFSNFFWDNTSKKLAIGTNAASAELTIIKTAAGSPVEILVQNNSNANNSHAIIMLQTTYTGGGGGDPKVQMNDGIQTWTMGIDRQNDHRYAVAFGPDLALNPAFSVDIGTGDTVGTLHSNGGRGVLHLNSSIAGGRVGFIAPTTSSQVDLTFPGNLPSATAALVSDNTGVMGFVKLGYGRYTLGTTSNLVNLTTATYDPALYMTTGSTTNMSGIFDVLMIADSTLTQFDFTLPAGIPFSNATDCLGTCALIDNTGVVVANGWIIGVGSSLTARATFMSPVGSAGNNWSLVATLTYYA